MREMLLSGRGGEGVVLASQLVADAFARAGCWVQSFPEFKAERRGAPISAFVRWDDRRPVHRRFKLRDCDVLAVLSPTPPAAELLRRVRPGGLVVLNRSARFAYRGHFAIARVPASSVARDLGILSAEGRPMGNVAVLGACLKLLAPHALPFLEEAIAARMGASAPANTAAAREGFVRCVRQHARDGDERLELAPLPAVPSARPAFAVSSDDPSANHTGSWSLERPVLLERCNDCALCALFCPEGAIARVDGSMEIDYLYCKGCGICEDVCPVKDAIAMEEVPA